MISVGGLDFIALTVDPSKDRIPVPTPRSAPRAAARPTGEESGVVSPMALSDERPHRVRTDADVLVANRGEPLIWEGFGMLKNAQEIRLDFVIRTPGATKSCDNPNVIFTM